jgi:hypothetical protein
MCQERCKEHLGTEVTLELNVFGFFCCHCHLASNCMSIVEIGFSFNREIGERT